MTFGLDIRPEGHYLHATATGERTPDNIASVANQIIAACIEHQRDAALLDIREFVGRISIFDAFMIPASLFPSIRLAGLLKRLAVLDIKERRERTEFLESVSQKGGYNLRAFVDMDEAVAWLKADAELDAELDAKS